MLFQTMFELTGTIPVAAHPGGGSTVHTLVALAGAPNCGSLVSLSLKQANLLSNNSNAITYSVALFSEDPGDADLLFPETAYRFGNFTNVSGKTDYRATDWVTGLFLKDKAPGNGRRNTVWARVSVTSGDALAAWDLHYRMGFLQG